MREIEFNKTWWLKWYWPYIEKIYRTEAHYGTRQSGKTHQIARKLIYHSFQPNKFNVVHTRKSYDKIEGSTFKLLKDIVLESFPNDFTIVKDHFQIINKHTGNWFRGLGMDKPENAKAIEGANIAWMNECNQFTIEDYDFLDTTIRAANDCEISMIMDWNPESRSHWLHGEHLSLTERSNCVIVKSTFWDNYLIDREAFHNKLLEIKRRGAEGERRYKIWALAEWGVEDPNKLFARDFYREKHIGEVAYDPLYDIYLAFDLNYDPTCLAIQMQGNNLCVLEEYHEEGMTLPILLRHIKGKYGDGFFIINGDASGHYSRNITDNSTSYDIIKSLLGLSWSNFNVPKANPSHKRSRQLTNIMLSFHNVLIHPSCKELIADLESVEVDVKEGIDEYKKHHPERSHWLDAFRYHLFAEHNNRASEIGI
jgi:PBSX family phage terminase large subunit